jgi:hypothetical protein
VGIGASAGVLKLEMRFLLQVRYLPSLVSVWLMQFYYDNWLQTAEWIRMETQFGFRD